ncbi:MAG: hypothetical protein GWN07_36575, partial [Actinobacteria bacterium]|nr:hypothetical protein [Actinomycetota bacterium]NIS36404.1 hypothetical protein [Actinomycetota bacterium]NIU70925.1 hypothetical protein [Actinomycetota bacterium]NIW32858.1 hypothetical protein [Actinomycetota bacterium]NIX25024.1 hypothetical protein [Actinomycetota bacterium]
MATPLVSRAGWGAREPRSITRRDLSMNTAHYGGPSPWGTNVNRSTPTMFAATTDHNRCATIVRAYQAFHMDNRGWVDIAYSSLVCPHGTRYEGRGKDVRTAAQGSAGNDVSHATCYIAGDGDPLTAGARLAFEDEDDRLDPLLKGHRDWMLTACPGDPLYQWVYTRTPEEDDMEYTLAEIGDEVERRLNTFAGKRWGAKPALTISEAMGKWASDPAAVNLPRIQAKLDQLLAAVGQIDDDV